eukprot:GCRY01000620.1.p1 GENE.GCRY01000620.1~~GCRY01000620.1.p1  ORF type:complete len:283 (+),score=75.98 GCRY01000620.1:751-1599(+)
MRTPTHTCSGVRGNAETASLGLQLLENDLAWLANDKWVVIEQVFVQCLDSGKLQEAQALLKMLHNKFPKSLRVKRLSGMVLEYQQSFGEAMRLYDDILKADPTNTAAAKRKVSIYKAKGEYAEALRSAKEYVNFAMNDAEGWAEMAELHALLGQYGEAAFCTEEVLLHDPFNAATHCRLADLLYTEGSVASLSKAKKHYAQALELASPEYVRPLWGAVMAVVQLIENRAADENDAKFLRALIARLKTVYSQHATALLPLAEGALGEYEPLASAQQNVKKLEK